MQKDSVLVSSALRTAKIIYFGIALQATIFVFWGMQFFLMAETPAVGGWAVYIIFSVMAFLSFFYGVRFFQNYTRFRRQQILKLQAPKRKETLLLVTAIHFLLLEFVSVIGILLAIFVQQKYVIIPFYLLFLIGLALSYPKQNWYNSFFEDSHGTESI